MKRMMPRTIAANILTILAMAMITSQKMGLCKMIVLRYIQFVLIYINIRINSVCKYNAY